MTPTDRDARTDAAQPTHTPTPWQWDEPSNWYGIAARISNAKFEPIAQVQLSGWPRRVGLANARLIVTSVNAHAALVAALRDLLNMCDSDPADFDHHLAFEECMEAAKNRARAALALAEPKGERT